VIARTVRDMRPGDVLTVPKRTAAAMVREARRMVVRRRAPSTLLLTRKQTHHRSDTCTVERIA